MDTDVSRNERTIEEISKTNLNYQRFSGINGKTVDKNKLVNDKYISSLCKWFCTDKMIGCGISHLMLYKHIRDHDRNGFALILEDDIRVSNPTANYEQEVSAIVDKYNKEIPQWQIIRLHSMGMNTASAAAQIINLKHIDTFANTILRYHIDIQQTVQFNIVNLNVLFDTQDQFIEYKYSINNLYYDNQKIGFYMNNEILKIFRFVILFSYAFFFIIIVYILRLYKYRRMCICAPSRARTCDFRLT